MTTTGSYACPLRGKVHLAKNLRVTGLTRKGVQVRIGGGVVLDLFWDTHGMSERGGYVSSPRIGARHIHLTDDVIGRYCQHWSDEEKSELLFERQALLFDLTLGSKNFEWIEPSSVLAPLRGS